MRTLLTAVVVAFAGVAAPAGAQLVTEMTPETIKAAIADTKNPGCYTLKKDFACFTTPYSRVAFAAREAKKGSEPFTRRQVTPEMVAPVVEVLALPQASYIMGSGRVGPLIGVKRIVVMPANRTNASQAIHPSDQLDLDQRYSSLLGSWWEVGGILARFPLAVVSAGNEVHVVYDGKGCADWHSKPKEECVFRFDLKGVK